MRTKQTGVRNQRDRMMQMLTRNQNWLKLIADNWTVIKEDEKFTDAKIPSEVRDLLFDLLYDKVSSTQELIAIRNLKLECRASSAYTTEFGGRIYKGKVSGITRFTCDLLYDDETVKVFTKFVSHPFYQCGSMSSNK
jgi:hypothetical protein